jgi:hypothetical protein
VKGDTLGPKSRLGTEGSDARRWASAQRAGVRPAQAFTLDPFILRYRLRGSDRAYYVQVAAHRPESRRLPILSLARWVRCRIQPSAKLRLSRPRLVNAARLTDSLVKKRCPRNHGLSISVPRGSWDSYFQIETLGTVSRAYLGVKTGPRPRRVLSGAFPYVVAWSA